MLVIPLVLDSISLVNPEHSIFPSKAKVSKWSCCYSYSLIFFH
ncbi:unnamed protein product [Musa textilis]